MANSKAAQKRARQNDKKRLQNASKKADLRTHMRKYLKLVDDKDVQAVKDLLPKVLKRLDKAAARGIVHKNAVARYKSRFMKQLNDLESAS